MMQIYNRIWSELNTTAHVENGSNGASTNETESLATKQGPPLTFLNQMFILKKAFSSKMIAYHKRVSLVKEPENVEETGKDPKSRNNSTASNNSLINDEFKDQYKLTLKKFFKTNKDLVQYLAQYEFNLVK